MGKFSTPVRTGPLAARVHVKRPNASAPKMRHQSWLGSRRTQQIVGRACGVRRRAVSDNVALCEWAEKRLQGIGTAQALDRKSKNDRPRAAPLQDIGVKAHRRQRLRDSRHALPRMDKMWRTNGVRRRVVAMQASSSRRPPSGVAATTFARRARRRRRRRSPRSCTRSPWRRCRGSRSAPWRAGVRRGLRR